MIVESIFTVESQHTDELGHLNHVYAIQFLEYARDDWYAQCGLWGGRPWSEEETLGTIVVNVNVNYRLECFLNEKLIVKTLPLHMGTKSYTLEQEIIKESGEVAIDGQSTSVVMDMQERTVVRVPDSLAKYLPEKG